MSKRSQLTECLTKGEFRHFILLAIVPAVMLILLVNVFVYYQGVKTQNNINIETQRSICYGDWQRWHGREGLITTFNAFFERNPDKVAVVEYKIVLATELPSLPVPACDDPFITPVP